MGRSGSKKIDYAQDKGKRKRGPKSTGVKKDRFLFRKSMIRSPDELELGGHMPSFMELQDILTDEDK